MLELRIGKDTGEWLLARLQAAGQDVAGLADTPAEAVELEAVLVAAMAADSLAREPFIPSGFEHGPKPEITAAITKCDEVLKQVEAPHALFVFEEKGCSISHNFCCIDHMGENVVGVIAMYTGLDEDEETEH